MNNDDTFRLALAFSLKWEGTAFTNDPDDNGGATRYGVTQRVYAAYLKTVGRLVRSVRYISRAELEAIYYRDYWIAAGCDRIKRAPLAVAHFDFAVNSGVKRAVIELQKQVRGYAITVDGVFGPRTEQFVNSALTAPLLHPYIDARVAFLRGIVARNPRQRKWLGGWLNRVSDLRKYIAKVQP